MSEQEILNDDWSDVLPSREVEQEILDILDGKSPKPVGWNLCSSKIPKWIKLRQERHHRESERNMPLLTELDLFLYRLQICRAYGARLASLPQLGFVAVSD